jgi:protease IV
MTQERLTRLLLLVYGLAVVVALTSFLPFHPWRKGKDGKASGGRLAIVEINGAIMGRTSESAFGSRDAEDIAKRLHRLSKDDSVKAILLRINSPGGTVGGTQEIFTEIQRCKAKGKKVVASMGDIAASGGYYLSAAADRIVADPGTITGSIGVILQFGNLEGLFQKLGVKLQVIKSGEHKDIGSPARPLTPEERKLLQASIDDAYDQFVAAVAQGRKMPVDQVRAVADGRIFTGRQAQKVGLVDELGNRQDAIKIAAKLAGLPDEPSILADTDHGVLGLLRQFSTRFSLGPLAVFNESASGPSLEYRWR